MVLITTTTTMRGLSLPQQPHQAAFLGHCWTICLYCLIRNQPLHHMFIVVLVQIVHRSRMIGLGAKPSLRVRYFGNDRNRTPDDEEDSNVTVFKVSCAVCLLRDLYQPNGFVAIVSKSSEEIWPTIQRAREACKQRRHNDLHADHAHFVCAVELSFL